MKQNLIQEDKTCSNNTTRFNKERTDHAIVGQDKTSYDKKGQNDVVG